MAETFANNSQSTLAAGIDADDVTLTVDSAASFPPGANFRILIDEEIMLVTNVAGTTFTVTRAQESTTAAAHDADAIVRHVFTAGAIAAIKTDVLTVAAANAAAVHPTMAHTHLLSSNTMSGYTAGSVLFAGVGQVDQDNANFFFNNTTNNLGIGCTPSYRLHVRRDDTTLPTVFIEKTSTTASGTTASDVLLYLSSPWATNDRCMMGFASSGVINHFGIKQGTADHYLIVNTTGTPVESFYVTNAGIIYVPATGIVVGAPTGGYKGAGTINAKGVYDDNTLLTDFVFEPDYKRTTFDELRRFIAEHKHLPTIDGRDSWEANGAPPLGTLISQIWETVECQALYILEIEARLRELENR